MSASRVARAVPDPESLTDERARELARLGIPGWFWEHTTSLACSCDPGQGGAPDDDCDVGFALFRLSASARAGRLDWHRGVR